MSASTGEIRRAEPADFDAIADLTADIFVGEGFTVAEQADQLTRIDERFKVTEILVAFENRREVVGAVSLVRPGSPFAQIARTAEIELRLLAVLPRCRGQGVGEALTQACIKSARTGGAKRVVLSTQPTMAAARRLYERLDFQRTPERDWVTCSGRHMLMYGLALS